jgi:hypothetical protein
LRLNRFFLLYHFVISFAAVALCWQTCVIAGIDGFNYSLAGFIFFATLFSYNTHFLLASQKNTSANQLKWFDSNKKTIFLLNSICLAATLFFWYQIKENSLIISIAVLLNAVYTLPLLFSAPLKLPLLFTFIKSHFIGFTWGFITIALPIAISKQNWTLTETILFLQRFMLVSLATIIFDYRDRLIDFEWGVLTPANRLSNNQFTLFFVFNLLLYTAAVIGMWQYSGNELHLFQLALLVPAWFFFRHETTPENDLFYLGWVDGLLLMSPLLSVPLLFK